MATCVLLESLFLDIVRAVRADVIAILKEFWPLLRHVVPASEKRGLNGIDVRDRDAKELDLRECDPWEFVCKLLHSGRNGAGTGEGPEESAILLLNAAIPTGVADESGGQRDA